jgi:hypothetical protein
MIFNRVKPLAPAWPLQHCPFSSGRNRQEGTFSSSVSYAGVMSMVFAIKKIVKVKSMREVRQVTIYCCTCNKNVKTFFIKNNFQRLAFSMIFSNICITGKMSTSRDCEIFKNTICRSESFTSTGNRERGSP